MSCTYKVKDLELRNVVTLELMKDKVTSAYIKDLIRFKNEIVTISRLNHPNIVKVFNSGNHMDRPYIIMEFLEGESLSQNLKRKEKPDISTSLCIISQLLDALVYLHKKRIVHMNINPDNIFLSRINDSFEVKLLDFGLSHAVALEEFKCHNHIAKMSPRKPSDFNADIPVEIDNIILKLVHKDPKSRYQSASDLLYDIKRYEKGEQLEILGQNPQQLVIESTVQPGKANKEPENYSMLVEEIAVVNERARISSNVNDSVGHRLTGTLMQLEAYIRILEIDPVKSKEMIYSVRSNMRRCMELLNETVKNLKPRSHINSIDSIRKMVDEINNYNTASVKFDITGQIRRLTPFIELCLFRNVQEAISNAIKHGSARNIHIQLGYYEKEICLTISDDGTGCKYINKGSGIRSMEDRVSILGGSLCLSGSGGFRIVTKIPVNDLPF